MGINPAGRVAVREPNQICGGRLLRELQASVDEFNRVVQLAHQMHLEVVAEVLPQQCGPGEPLRPMLVAKLFVADRARRFL